MIPHPSPSGLLAWLWICSLLAPAAALGQPFLRSSPVARITQTSYHGWTEALILANGYAEAVVVPAIGRVMQFRRVGEVDGPFWENRTLDGAHPDPHAKEWINFGGDKTWPAPQADWNVQTGRAWPPPKAFDSMPASASIDEKRGRITLTSAVDPHYGIRVIRSLTLAEGEVRLSIRTRYEKVEGDPVKTGVWIITQLRDPELAVMPVPGRSIFPEGFNRQSDQAPQGLLRLGNLLVMSRHRLASTKIGNDASALLWIGRRDMMLIEGPRRGGGEFPDQGSSAEIYTNPDPLAYVELELLGPLKTLKKGQSLEFTTRYTLLPRKRSNADEEARAVFAR